MMTLLSIAGTVAVAFLAWNLYRRFSAGRITALLERRKTSSRMVGRGELVDGNRHMTVAMALTDSTLFYENSDLQASVDLEWVREIEYDTELVTGQVVPDGQVLRLRSSSRTLEFVLPAETVTRWNVMLPPRGTRMAAAVGG